jgi:Heterokaryon incompatibility protein (HET)
LNDHEFRLIDVRQECVVIRPWQSRYLALTYVWGEVDQLQLKKCNLNSLQTPGSLRRLRHSIPTTICDAVSLVNLIGEEYLWVDALCLVQDDRESMIDGIQSMHFVYQNALASIVAADGPDANVGLRRLTSTSSSKTQSLQTIKPGFRLMALGAMEFHLQKSKWTSRAWT